MKAIKIITLSILLTIPLLFSSSHQTINKKNTKKDIAEYIDYCYADSMLIRPPNYIICDSEEEAKLRVGLLPMYDLKYTWDHIQSRWIVIIPFEELRSPYYVHTMPTLEGVLKWLDGEEYNTSKNKVIKKKRKHTILL